MPTTELKFNRQQLSFDYFENYLLLGDYPQHGPLYVLNLLAQVADQSWTEEKFWRAVKPEFILTVEEYLARYSSKHRLSAPVGEYPESLKKKAAKFNELTAALRQSLARRAPLVEVYAILLRFEAEAGVRFDHLDIFEKIGRKYLERR